METASSHVLWVQLTLLRGQRCLTSRSIVLVTEAAVQVVDPKGIFKAHFSLCGSSRSLIYSAFSISEISYEESRPEKESQRAAGECGRDGCFVKRIRVLIA